MKLLTSERNPGLRLAVDLVPDGAVTDDMLAEINQFTRRPHTREEVLVRGMRWINDLPMNETPWFCRKFDAAGVTQAVPLALGKPVRASFELGDHSGLPNARVFRTGLEQVGGFTIGTALAFWLNDPEGQRFVRLIDGGILAEVSPTLDFDRSYCSICGAEEMDCAHVPASIYDGMKCYRVMTEVSEVYEISIVWAGQQRNTSFYIAAARETRGAIDLNEHVKAMRTQREKPVRQPWDWMGKKSA